MLLELTFDRVVVHIVQLLPHDCFVRQLSNSTATVSGRVKTGSQSLMVMVRKYGASLPRKR